MANVDIVFDDLRSKGLIIKAKKLKKSKHGNFRAIRFPVRKIGYNEKFAGLESEYLRPVLLHEEAHLNQKSYSIFILEMDLLILAYAMLLVYYFNDFDFNSSQIIWLVITPFWVLLLLSSFRIFQDPIQMDEYECDKVSATKMKVNWGVRKTSSLFGKALKSLESEPKSKQSPLDRLSIFFLDGMHPTIEERVKRLEETIDDKEE